MRGGVLDASPSPPHAHSTAHYAPNTLFLLASSLSQKEKAAFIEMPSPYSCPSAPGRRSGWRPYKEVKERDTSFSSPRGTRGKKSKFRRMPRLDLHWTFKTQMLHIARGRASRHIRSRHRRLSLRRRLSSCRYFLASNGHHHEPEGEDSSHGGRLGSHSGQA